MMGAVLTEERAAPAEGGKAVKGERADRATVLSRVIAGSGVAILFLSAMLGAFSLALLLAVIVVGAAVVLPVAIFIGWLRKLVRPRPGGL
ncbi:MAG: hypothetical protein V3U26_02055 [Dehalococcoidia bacterium]